MNRLAKFQLPRYPNFGFRAFQSFSRPQVLKPALYSTVQYSAVYIREKDSVQYSISNIRRGKYCPATPNTPTTTSPSCSGYPPGITILFFFWAKKLNNWKFLLNFFFEKKCFFEICRDILRISDFLTIFDLFWIFGVSSGFLDFILIFWIFFWIFELFFWFLNFLIFFDFFLDFLWIFLGFFGFLLKLLRLLLKVTKVSTGHQKLPKMDQNSIISSFFCPKGQKSLGLRPKPCAGARSRP